MAFTYRYRELPGKKGFKTKTPSIPVLIRGGARTELQVVALVDSGADCSVIPKGIAEVLNLDLNGPKQDSFGFGGKIVCIESRISMVLEQNHERAEIDLPVLVSPDDTCPPILGRRGFFDIFKITFDSKNRHLTLKRNSASAPYGSR